MFLILFVLVGFVSCDLFKVGNETDKVPVPLFDYESVDKGISMQEMDGNDETQLAKFCFEWYAPAIVGFKEITASEVSKYKPTVFGQELSISVEMDSKDIFLITGTSDGFSIEIIYNRNAQKFSYIQSFYASGWGGEAKDGHYLGITKGIDLTLKGNSVNGNFCYYFVTKTSSSDLNSFGMGSGEYYSSNKVAGIVIYEIDIPSEDSLACYTSSSDNTQASILANGIEQYYLEKLAQRIEWGMLVYKVGGEYYNLGDMGLHPATKSDMQARINTVDSNWQLCNGAESFASLEELLQKEQQEREQIL